uniref:Uncharacterized protein n=1 Tax=Arundo donax TaxID=35708 RepID=A0A0A9EMM8_ARUDO
MVPKSRAIIVVKKNRTALYWVPPVGQVLLAEASQALCEERLRVRGGEVEVT